MKLTSGIFGVMLVTVLSATSVAAQASDSSSATQKVQPTERPRLPDSVCSRTSSCVEQTFFLANQSQTNEQNELITALRNLVPPDVKMYLISTQQAIVASGSVEQMALVQKLINELDRPRKTYRLTYTITEMDGAKRIGVQHFSIVIAEGQRTTLKQGSKVPVATGSYAPSNSVAQTQFTYLDVGMNFDATLDGVAGGARLKSKVEQSSVAEQVSGVGTQDPIIRASVLEGTALLAMNKPLTLGSIDVPGSTRHLDVEVVVDLVK